MLRLSATIHSFAAAKLAATDVVCVRPNDAMLLGKVTYLPTNIGTDTANQETEAG